MTKILVTESIAAVSEAELEGPVQTVLENLKVYDGMDNAYTNHRFALEHYGYDDAFNIYLVGDRLETDAEYARRLKKEAVAKSIDQKKKKQKEVKERNQLSRLIKKYGVPDVE